MGKTVITVWVKPITLKRIKQQLVQQFDEPVPQSALIRVLLRLWMQGDIPITAAEVKALDVEEVEYELT